MKVRDRKLLLMYSISGMMFVIEEREKVVLTIRGFSCIGNVKLNKVCKSPKVFARKDQSLLVNYS